MSEHDHDAFDALRRLDGPAGLGDGVEDRIEAEMLARFDEQATIGPTADEPPVVELVTATERQSRRSHRSIVALATAAATAAVIAGVVLFTGRDQPTEPADPIDEPDPTTTTIVGDAVAAQQLDAFCTQVVIPARDADAGWVPSGVGSEARGFMIIAVERAAEAAGAVGPPLADRWGDFDERLRNAATEARLATSLGEADGDAAVEAARDLLFTVGAAAGVDPVPSTCSPPTGSDGGS